MKSSGTSQARNSSTPLDTGPGIGRPALAFRCAIFEEEILEHVDVLHRYALRLTGDPAQAEDLVQETYVRALKRWVQLDDWYTARSWLVSILRNLYLDRYRRRVKRRARIALRDLESLPEPRAADGVTAEIFDHVLDTEVDHALQILPLEFREPVLLCDLNGLSYAEAAEVLGVPLGTVKSRLYRARRILKRALYQYATTHHFIAGAATEGGTKP